MTKNGGSLRIESNSKQEALDALSKHLGLFQQEKSSYGTTIHADTINWLNATYTPDQLRALLEVMDHPALTPSGETE